MKRTPVQKTAPRARHLPCECAASSAPTALPRARRLLCLVLGVALTVACAEPVPGTLPPKQGFAFPISLALSEPGGGEPSVLYVANSNFSLKYNRGTLLAIDLSKLAPFEPVPTGGPAQLDVSAAIDPAKGYVYLPNFAGAIAAWSCEGCPPNSPPSAIFVPIRGTPEVVAIRVNGAALDCWDSPPGDDSSAGRQDCVHDPIQLSRGEARANEPFAAAVVGARIAISHASYGLLDGAEAAFIAWLEPQNPRNVELFTLELADSEGVAHRAAPATAMGAFGAALYVTTSDVTALTPVRRLADGALEDLGLYAQGRFGEARGVAPSTDGERLFVTVRGSRYSSLPPTSGPNGMAILGLEESAAPQLKAFVPLPEGASQLLAIAREGMRDLVAIACTDSNTVALYDDELGRVVSLAQGIAGPYSLVAGARPSGGVRLYVASFSGNGIELLDLEDPNHAERLLHVAQLK